MPLAVSFDLMISSGVDVRYPCARRFSLRIRCRVDRLLPNAMSIRCQRRNCFGNALRTSVPSTHGQRPPAIRLWRVPPVVELDSHARVVCHPFAHQPLSRRVAAMSIDDQDSLEPLLCHHVENVAQERQIRFDPQCNGSWKRAKVRRDPVREHREDRYP